MSQHALNIANESGAAFRTDVNAALQALASNSSGASAPATTYAYQPWYDTTNGLLKIRNGANSAWIIIGPLADSTQHVIYTNNTAQVYVDSSGKVGVANASPTYQLDVTGDINCTGALRVGGTAIPTGYNFINGGTASFSSNAYTITPSPAISSYSANQLFLVYIANANTSTTPTLNANSQGAKTIKKQIGAGKVAVAIGDLQANTFALFAYDGTDIMLINPRAYSQGADIATASTLNLDTATGDYVNATGTTNVTAITLSQGRQVTVQCSGAAKYSNGASLIMPGGVDFTSAAGDILIFRGEASSVVRCVGGVRADGRALVPAIPQNSKSAAYTTVLTDAGKHIYHPSSDNNARTFTIDSNANVPYQVGTAITFVNEINTVTIAITSDTLTLCGAGSTGSRTLAANGIATALKVSSTKWVISGTGLT